MLLKTFLNADLLTELWAIVNNAGVLWGFEVELTDLEYFKETMEVNGFGPIRVTKAFLPLLRQSRGRIVNITSMGSKLLTLFPLFLKNFKLLSCSLYCRI